MTAGEITDRVLSRVDEDKDNPISVTEAEALAAVNEGQQFAAMLTLCLEGTASLPLPATTCFVQIRSQIPNFLAPLRIDGPAGRLRPATPTQLFLENEAWQVSPGDPARYSTLGCQFLAVTPQPAEDLVLPMVYARWPDVMVANDTPELPEANHLDLVDYGVYKVRLKEGQQGLLRSFKRFNRFLDRMTILGNFVRARSRAAGYDMLPLELALFDRSRLFAAVPEGKG